MVNKEEEQKKVELFKAFHNASVYGATLLKAREEETKFAKIKLYYDTDDIFRRQIDGLKIRMKKKKVKPKVIDEKIAILLREAEYRRYIASFENMKINYEARKKEMTKIKQAFS